MIEKQIFQQLQGTKFMLETQAEGNQGLTGFET